MGYFEAVDRGSAAKRIVLGFGSGAADLRTAVEGYLMTEQGLRRLGSGTLESKGGRTPGIAVPLGVAVATGNPIGLIVMRAVQVGGEATGRSTIERETQRTAKEITAQRRVAFQKQGWIECGGPRFGTRDSEDGRAYEPHR
jgi:hypothetical protein